MQMMIEMQDHLTEAGISNAPDIATLKSLVDELADGEILSLTLEGMVLSNGQEEE